jgi:hypothetical protein
MNSEETKAILEVFVMKESKKETRTSKLILDVKELPLYLTVCFVVLSTFTAFLFFKMIFQQ